MAWRKDVVEAFLKTKSDLSPQTVTDIKARMDERVNADGIFSAGVLDEVMGDEKLARAFEQAWETDPTLHNTTS